MSKKSSPDSSFKTLCAAANKLYDDGKKEESMKFLDSSFSSLGRITAYGKYMMCSFKSHYYFNKTDYERSKEYEDSALDIIEHSDLRKQYPSEYIHTLIEKGHVLNATGKTQEAYDYYVKAGIVVKQLTDTCSLNEYDYQIGMSLFRQHKLRMAIDYFVSAFNDALACTDTIKPYYRMQELLSNAALCYVQLKKYDSSIYYYDSAMSFINKNEEKFNNKTMADVARAVVYKNLGGVMANLGKMDSAESLILKSIDISEKSDKDPKDAQSTKKLLLVIYYLKKDYSHLFATLQDVKRSLDTLPDVTTKKAWWELSIAYYKQTNEFENALKYTEDYMTFKDSLTNASGANSNNNIVNELKDKEMKYQITILKKNNELSKLYLWITLSITLFLVILVTQVYLNFKKSTLKNRQINLQKQELERSNNDKDRILNVVAHDLRSPVGGVAYLAEMLLEGQEIPGIPKDEYLEMIKKSSENSLQLINELVGFTNDDNKKVNKSVFDINDLIIENTRFMNYKMNEKNQSLRIDVPPHPLNIYADKKKINRVIGNLLTNAIKFTHTGGQISIVVKEEGQNILIKIQDNGIGIPAVLKPGLFEMFTSAKRSGTLGEKSFGLGLAISRQIVEDHGGRIWVESEEGKGSAFFVQLPK